MLCLEKKGFNCPNAPDNFVYHFNCFFIFVFILFSLSFQFFFFLFCQKLLTILIENIVREN